MGKEAGELLNLVLGTVSYHFHIRFMLRLRSLPNNWMVVRLWKLVTAIRTGFLEISDLLAYPAHNRITFRTSPHLLYSAQPTTKTNNNKIRTGFIQVSINLIPTHYAKSTDSTHVIYRPHEA